MFKIKLFPIIFIVSISFGQTITSEIIETSDAYFAEDQYRKVVNVNDHNFVLAECVIDKPTICRYLLYQYDKHMNFKHVRCLDVSEMKGSKVLSIQKLDDKLVIVYYVKDNINKKASLVIKLWIPERRKFNKEQVLIPLIYSKELEAHIESFELNNMNLVVNYRTYDGVDKKQVENGFRYYNQKLELINESKQLKNSFDNFYSFQTDTNNSLYFLSNFYDSAHNKKDFCLIVINNRSNVILKKRIEFSSENMLDVKLKVNPNQKIVLAGFYEKPINSYSDRTGIFLFLLNPNTLVVEKSFKKLISTRLLTHKESKPIKQEVRKNIKEKKDIGIDENYRVFDIIIKNNEELVIVGNQFTYEEQTRKNKRGIYRTKYIINNGNILLFSFTSNGRYKSEVKIRKQQYLKTVLPRNASMYPYFACKEVDNNIYIMYSDHINNHNSKSDSLYNYNISRKLGVITVYKLSNRGTLTKSMVLRNKEFKGFPALAYYADMSYYKWFFVTFGKQGLREAVILDFEQEN